MFSGAEGFKCISIGTQADLGTGQQVAEGQCAKANPAVTTDAQCSGQFGNMGLAYSLFSTCFCREVTTHHP